MEKAIKQRLLGGLVLVAGAALFLPILLDGSGSQLVVPPMPAAPRVPTVEAVAPGLEKQAQALDQSVAAAHAEPAAPAVAGEVSPDAAAVAAPAPAPAPAPKKEQAAPVPVPRPEATPKKTMAPVAATAAADGLPQAWVVQVASLSGRDKADALVQKLHKKGFHGFVHRQGGEWKVLVGPELHKEVAETAKQRLATDPELRLNGWLQPWKP